MGMLGAREYRELLIADLVLRRGLAPARDVATALRRYWDGRSTAGASFGTELRGLMDVSVETLSDTTLREVEAAVDRLIDEAGGDARAALRREGGLDPSVRAYLAKAGSHLGLDVAHALAENSPDLRAMPTGRYGDFLVVGEGGMGVVYMALDSELNRFVALKMIRPDVAEGQVGAPPTTPMAVARPTGDTPTSRAFEELKRRFLQEATVTAGLEHPGIVPVYELGQTPQGIPYYTMRFVRGQRTLQQAMEEARQGPFEARIALLEPFLRLCDTVAYAHSRGVLHRDLKPANIALGEFGEVVVLDWGLAKLSGSEAPADSLWQGRIKELRRSADFHTLQTAIGTPGYMCPEAARGDLGAVDARGDVYSLGAILFELLTGRLPHDVRVSDAGRLEVLAVPGVTMRSLAPEAPPALEELCARAVALEAEHRLAEVGALSAGIRAWQAASAREREIEGLRRDTAAILDAARGLTGVDRIRQVDRAAAVLHQLEARAGDDRAARALASDVETLRNQGMREHARSSNRRLLRRVAVVALAVVAVGSLLVAGAFEKRRRAEARLVAESQREQGRRYLLEGRPLHALAFLESAYQAMPDDHVTRILVARALGTLQLASRVFEHKQNVMGVVALRGGRLASIDMSGALVISDTAAPERSQIVVAKGPSFERIVASPSGDVFLAARDRASALLVDADTGTIRAELPAEGDSHVGAVDPSGARVLVVGKEDEIVVWDVGSVRPLWRSELLGSAITAAALAGDYVVVGTKNTHAHLWNWRERRLVRSWTPNLAQLTQIGFAPDGAHFVLAGYDRRVLVCRTTDGTVEHDLRPHQRSVIRAGYDASGTRIVSASWDGDVVVTDAVTGIESIRLPADGAIVTAAAFSGSGERVAAGYGDGLIRVWHAASGQLLATLVGHADQVNDLVFVAGEDRLASSSSDGTVRLWDLPPSRTWSGPLAERGTRLTYAGFLPSGGLVVALRDGRLAEYTPEGGGLAWAMPHEGPAVEEAAISRDGRLLAASVGQTAMEVWDLARRELVRRWTGWAPVRDLEFSANGRLLHSTHADDENRISDVTSGVSERQRHHQGGGFTVSVAPSGDTLALAGWNPALTLLDLAGSKAPRTLGNVGDITTSGSFSPDGRLLAVGYWNEDTRLWSPVSGRELGTLSSDRRPQFGLAWRADGRLLAGWSGETGLGETRVWDVESAGLVLRLANVRFARGPEAFSRDGNRLVLVAAAGPPMLISLSETHLTPPELQAWVLEHVPYVVEGSRLRRRAATPPARR